MSTTLSAPVIAASQPGMADALRAALELALRGIFDPILCKSWRRTGSGARGDAEGPFDYDRFATDIGAVVDHIGKPSSWWGTVWGRPSRSWSPRPARTAPWVWPCWLRCHWRGGTCRPRVLSARRHGPFPLVLHNQNAYGYVVNQSRCTMACVQRRCLTRGIETDP
jgi:hypothetical protein